MTATLNPVNGIPVTASSSSPCPSTSRSSSSFTSWAATKEQETQSHVSCNHCIINDTCPITTGVSGVRCGITTDNKHHILYCLPTHKPPAAGLPWHSHTAAAHCGFANQLQNMVAPYRLCGRIRNTCCSIIHKLYLFHVENLKHAFYPYQNYTLTPSLQMEPTARIRQWRPSDRFGQVSHCIPTYPKHMGQTTICICNYTVSLWGGFFQLEQ